MTPKRLDELIAVYRDGLLQDTLGFWFPRCLDTRHGGYMIARDRDGRISVPLKGNLWKGPFHMPRMQLTCWRIAEMMKDQVNHRK